MVPVSEGPLKVGTELDVKLRVWCSEHGNLWAYHTEYGRGDGGKNIIVQVLDTKDRITRISINSYEIVTRLD